MDTLYVNNSHVLQLTRLKDAYGQLIRDATTVEATITDMNDVPVAGASWPVPLYWDGTKEVYEAQLPADIEVEQGKRYLLVITAEEGTARYEATRYVDVERRYD